MHLHTYRCVNLSSLCPPPHLDVAGVPVTVQEVDGDDEGGRGGVVHVTQALAQAYLLLLCRLQPLQGLLHRLLSLELCIIHLGGGAGEGQVCQ